MAIAAELVHAPFTAGQVQSLRAYQAAHPGVFYCGRPTCHHNRPGNRPFQVNETGWWCVCGNWQGWALDYQANWEWRDGRGGEHRDGVRLRPRHSPA